MSDAGDASGALRDARESQNWLMHALYVQQQLSECLRVADEQIERQPNSEYALYMKGLVLRSQGKINDSLQFFQKATSLNPHNVANLKQVARSLYLLGKQKAAIGVYEAARKLGADDWDIWHNTGMCYAYLKSFDKAIECFRRSLTLQRHDRTYVELGKALAAKEDYKQAVDVFLEALQHFPDNAEILTQLGLWYLRLGEHHRAFDYLGNALTHDPRNPKTLLAAGSIIQDHSDLDTAVSKYRVAAARSPSSAQLWNNIGMCLFGKGKHVAAMSCLKRALALAPFEWIIAYNLGLVHLHAQLFASAFHYMSASINLKPDFASSYMYLAIALSHLDDTENACAAFEKAIEMEPDPLFELNYAAALNRLGQKEAARAHFANFEHLFAEADDETRADPDILDLQSKLRHVL